MRPNASPSVSSASGESGELERLVTAAGGEPGPLSPLGMAYLGGLVERSITGEVLATELNRITATRGGGGPAVLRLDNGPEMIAAALAEWAGTRTGMLFIPPGEPWRNPFIESFNGRLRDELLRRAYLRVRAVGVVVRQPEVVERDPHQHGDQGDRYQARVQVINPASRRRGPR